MYIKDRYKNKSYKLLNRFNLGLQNGEQQNINEIKFSIGSKLYLEIVNNKSKMDILKDMIVTLTLLYMI